MPANEKLAAAMATRAWVRAPAGRPAWWRCQPMSPASRPARLICRVSTRSVLVGRLQVKGPFPPVVVVFVVSPSVGDEQVICLEQRYTSSPRCSAQFYWLDLSLIHI